MLTRPAGYDMPTPRPERVRPRPQFFFVAEAEATMYEADARHVREQLSVYEHEDEDISVQNIVFSKQPIHNKMIVHGCIVNIN